MTGAQHSLEGGFADAPREASRVFRAALQAMARPGRIETVAGAVGPAPMSNAAAALILTLGDPGTGIWLAPGHDTDAIRAWIGFHAGARLVAPEAADFAIGRWEALQPLSRFPTGTPEYPDRSVTLIVERDGLSRKGVTLAGPGIDGTTSFDLPEPGAFRDNNRRFPLGFDSFFTAGDALAGLPRSTRILEDG